MAHHQPSVLDLRRAILALALLGCCSGTIAAQEPVPAATAEPVAASYPIDLATVLRLARADNLDVQLARERINEARAQHAGALARFLPWVSVGVSYRRHEGRTQAVDGTIIASDKDSISVGPTLTAQVDLGEAWFATLAARQHIKAAEAALGAQQQSSTLAAVSGYFELLKAGALQAANADALETSRQYEQQLQGGIAAGLILRGDLLRVQTQTHRYQAAVLQAGQQRRLAAARLAELLHLDPNVDLESQDGELIPIVLAEASRDQTSLLDEARATRAEREQGAAQVAAARAASTNALYGPLVPSLGVQTFFGGLGGGPDGVSSSFGGSRDYYFGVNWRLGPGGLFDLSRIRAAKARLAMAEIGAEQIEIGIARQIVEASERVRSSDARLIASRDGLEAATETLRLTRERKQLGVGAVLEDIQAQQELVRARGDYVDAVTEHNKAQYELRRAIGGL